MATMAPVHHPSTSVDTGDSQPSSDAASPTNGVSETPPPPPLAPNPPLIPPANAPVGSAGSGGLSGGSGSGSAPPPISRQKIELLAGSLQRIAQCTDRSPAASRLRALLTAADAFKAMVASDAALLALSPDDLSTLTHPFIAACQQNPSTESLACAALDSIERLLAHGVVDASTPYVAAPGAPQAVAPASLFIVSDRPSDMVKTEEKRKRTVAKAERKKRRDAEKVATAAEAATTESTAAVPADDDAGATAEVTEKSADNVADSAVAAAVTADANDEEEEEDVEVLTLMDVFVDAVRLRVAGPHEDVQVRVVRTLLTCVAASNLQGQCLTRAVAAMLEVLLYSPQSPQIQGTGKASVSQIVGLIQRRLESSVSDSLAASKMGSPQKNSSNFADAAGPASESQKTADSKSEKFDSKYSDVDVKSGECGELDERQLANPSRHVPVWVDASDVFSLFVDLLAELPRTQGSLGITFTHNFLIGLNPKELQDSLSPLFVAQLRRIPGLLVPLLCSSNTAVCKNAFYLLQHLVQSWRQVLWRELAVVLQFCGVITEQATTHTHKAMALSTFQSILTHDSTALEFFVNFDATPGLAPLVGNITSKVSRAVSSTHKYLPIAQDEQLRAIALAALSGFVKSLGESHEHDLERDPLAAVMLAKGSGCVSPVDGALDATESSSVFAGKTPMPPLTTGQSFGHVDPTNPSVSVKPPPAASPSRAAGEEPADTSKPLGKRGSGRRARRGRGGSKKGRSSTNAGDGNDDGLLSGGGSMLLSEDGSVVIPSANVTPGAGPADAHARADGEECGVNTERSKTSGASGLPPVPAGMFGDDDTTAPPAQGQPKSSGGLPPVPAGMFDDEPPSAMPPPTSSGGLPPVPAGMFGDDDDAPPARPPPSSGGLPPVPAGMFGDDDDAAVPAQSGGGLPPVPAGMFGDEDDGEAPAPTAGGLPPVPAGMFGDDDADADAAAPPAAAVSAASPTVVLKQTFAKVAEVKTGCTIYELMEHKRAVEAVLDAFNEKPKIGLAAAIQAGMLADMAPLNVARFLRTRGLNKVKVGEYLGGSSDDAKLVMHHFVGDHDYTGMTLDDAMRSILGQFKIVGEAAIVDRTMERFANRFCEDNPGVFSSPDTAYVLAFSTMMLNTDLHSVSVTEKMTQAQFVSTNRGIDDGKDLPTPLLEGIYRRIKMNEIKLVDDDATAMVLEENESKAHRAALASMGPDEKPAPWNPEAAITRTARRLQTLAVDDNATYIGGDRLPIGAAQVMWGRSWHVCLAAFSLVADDGVVSKKITERCLDGVERAIRLACRTANSDDAKNAFVGVLTRTIKCPVISALQTKHTAALSAAKKVTHAKHAGLLGERVWHDLLTCVAAFRKVVESCSDESLARALEHVREMKEKDAAIGSALTTSPSTSGLSGVGGSASNGGGSSGGNAGSPSSGQSGPGSSSAAKDSRDRRGDRKSTGPFGKALGDSDNNANVDKITKETVIKKRAEMLKSTEAVFDAGSQLSDEHLVDLMSATARGAAEDLSVKGVTASFMLSQLFHLFSNAVPRGNAVWSALYWPLMGQVLVQLLLTKSPFTSAVVFQHLENFIVEGVFGLRSASSIAAGSSSSTPADQSLPRGGARVRSTRQSGQGGIPPVASTDGLGSSVSMLAPPSTQDLLSEDSTDILQSPLPSTDTNGEQKAVRIVEQLLCQPALSIVSEAVLRSSHRLVRQNAVEMLSRTIAAAGPKLQNCWKIVVRSLARAHCDATLQGLAFTTFLQCTAHFAGLTEDEAIETVIAIADMAAGARGQMLVQIKCLELLELSPWLRCLPGDVIEQLGALDDPAAVGSVAANFASYANRDEKERVSLGHNSAFWRAVVGSFCSLLVVPGVTGSFRDTVAATLQRIMLQHGHGFTQSLWDELPHSVLLPTVAAVLDDAENAALVEAPTPTAAQASTPAAHPSSRKRGSVQQSSTESGVEVTERQSHIYCGGVIDALLSGHAALLGTFPKQLATQRAAFLQPVIACIHHSSIEARQVGLRHLRHWVEDAGELQDMDCKSLAKEITMLVQQLSGCADASLPSSAVAHGATPLSAEQSHMSIMTSSPDLKIASSSGKRASVCVSSSTPIFADASDTTIPAAASIAAALDAAAASTDVDGKDSPSVSPQRAQATAQTQSVRRGASLDRVPASDFSMVPHMPTSSISVVMPPLGSPLAALPEKPLPATATTAANPSTTGGAAGSGGHNTTPKKNAPPAGRGGHKHGPATSTGRHAPSSSTASLSSACIAVHALRAPAQCVPTSGWDLALPVLELIETAIGQNSTVLRFSRSDLFVALRSLLRLCESLSAFDSAGLDHHPCAVDGDSGATFVGDTRQATPSRPKGASAAAGRGAAATGASVVGRSRSGSSGPTPSEVLAVERVALRTACKLSSSLPSAIGFAWAGEILNSFVAASDCLRAQHGGASADASFVGSASASGKTPAPGADARGMAKAAGTTPQRVSVLADATFTVLHGFIESTDDGSVAAFCDAHHQVLCDLIRCCEFRISGCLAVLFARLRTIEKTAANKAVDETEDL